MSSCRSKLERVKAALPGTKEHKAKKEAEADAEVGQLGA
jgi:hypothetical protein